MFILDFMKDFLYFLNIYSPLITAFIAGIGVFYARRWLKDQARLRKLDLAAKAYGLIYQFEIIFSKLTKEGEPSLLGKSEELQGYHLWEEEQSKKQEGCAINEVYCVDDDYYLFCRQAFELIIHQNENLFKALYKLIPETKWWLKEDGISDQIKTLLDNFNTMDEAHKWLCLMRADLVDRIPDEVTEETCKSIIYSKNFIENMNQRCEKLKNNLDKYNPNI